MKGAHADAALYFKAWAQNKVGQRADALSTLAALTKDYPKSRYLTAGEGARCRSAAQTAASQSSLKTRATTTSSSTRSRRCMNSDPEKAVPMIEQVLGGTASPRVKSKALFVLAQSDSPRARDVLKKVAMGTSTPDLAESSD